MILCGFILCVIFFSHRWQRCWICSRIFWSLKVINMSVLTEGLLAASGRRPLTASTVSFSIHNLFHLQFVRPFAACVLGHGEPPALGFPSQRRAPSSSASCSRREPEVSALTWRVPTRSSSTTLIGILTTTSKYWCLTLACFLLRL